MATISEQSIRPKASTKLTRNSKIFKTIIKAIHDKKGSNVVSLDLRKILEASADFFIVCEASNPNQVKAIADNVQDIVKKETNEAAYKFEGYQAQQWILVDYVNVVVHVFLAETRKFYRLEEMWHDAPSMEHTDEPTVKPAK